MAKKKKETVADEATKDNITKVEIKQTNEDDNVIKVDLTKKPETDAVQKQSTDEVPVRDESETSGEVQEENKEVVEEVTGEGEKIAEEVQSEQPVVEEITEEKIEEQVEELVEETKEAIAEAQQTGKELPENIQKLVDFMEETGGDINDYVRLNQDYSSYDDNSILREYYKQTKKHLTDDEISFLMQDSFTIDEEEDDEREIKK